jgi:hypothetical protein
MYGSYEMAAEQARRALVLEGRGEIRVQAFGLEGVKTAVLLLAQVGAWAGLYAVRDLPRAL